ncbi:Ig-like domain-containing protein, partial [Bradyrhizobium campsiandrae]
LKSVLITSLPTLGTLSLNGTAVTASQAISAADIAAGKLVYTPGVGSGAAYASFGFEVVDTGGTANGGHDTSAAATVTVSVGAVNHAPVTSDVTVSTNEGAAYIFKTTDFAFSDPNDTPANALKSVLITSLPTLGTLSLNGTAVTASQAIAAADIAAGKLVYTPGVGSGAAYASFGFEVVDTGGTANGGHDTSTAAKVTIAVTASTPAPLAKDDTFTIASSMTIDATRLLSNDTTGDPTLLVLTNTLNPSHGTVSYDSAKHILSFVAEAGFAGTAGFDYQVQYASGSASAQAHVTINVVPPSVVTLVAGTVRLPSQPVGQAITVSFDDLLANVFQSTNVTLTIASADQPKNGTVALDPLARTVTFTPNAGFTGDGSFRFGASDGNHYSFGTAIVRFGTVATAHAPVANGDTYNYQLGDKIVLPVSSLLANDTDADHIIPTITGVSGAVGGSVAFDSSHGLIQFTPSGAGVAGFDYAITDGVHAASAHVTLNIKAPPQAPVGVIDSFATKENQSIEIPFASLLANDVDFGNAPLSFVNVTGASGGTYAIDLQKNVVLFTPNPNFVGRAYFNYSMTDGTLTGSSTAFVVVSPVASAPIAVNDSFVGFKNQPLVISASTLLLNDSDPNKGTLSLASVANPVGGIVALSTNGKTVTFTPTTGFTGNASFDYTVSNGQLSSAAHVNVLIEEKSAASQLVDDAIAGAENTSITLTASRLFANDIVAKNQKLTLTGVSDILNGSAVFDAVKQTITFTPTPDFNDTNGLASLTYSASDGLTTMTARVTIDLAPRHSAPVVSQVSFDTLAGQPVQISFATLLATASSPDGLALHIANVLNPHGGTISVDFDHQVVVFTPSTTAGVDSFSYLVSDGVSTTSGTATVNAYPKAVADTVTTSKNQTISIPVAALTANDGGSLTLPIGAVSAVGSPVNGSVVFDQVNGIIQFTPNPGFTGKASFTYTIGSGNLASTAVVTVNVTAAVVPSAVVGVPEVITKPAAQIVTISAAELLGNAWQPDGRPLSLQGVLQVSGGTMSYNAATGMVTIDFGTAKPKSLTILFAIGDGRTAALVRSTIKLSALDAKAVPRTVIEHGEEVQQPIVLAAAEADQMGSAAGTGVAVTRAAADGASLPNANAARTSAIRIASTQAASADQIAIMMGDQPRRSDVLQALFAGGILLPAMVKRSKPRDAGGRENARTATGVLCIFDSESDRLVPESTEDPEQSDLPSLPRIAAAGDDDDWIYLRSGR